MGRRAGGRGVLSPLETGGGWFLSAPLFKQIFKDAAQLEQLGNRREGGRGGGEEGGGGKGKEIQRGSIQ